jgi:hypothetical protein
MGIGDIPCQARLFQRHHQKPRIQKPALFFSVSCPTSASKIAFWRELVCAKGRGVCSLFWDACLSRYSDRHCSDLDLHQHPGSNPFRCLSVHPSEPSFQSTGCIRGSAYPPCADAPSRPRQGARRSGRATPVRHSSIHRGKTGIDDASNNNSSRNAEAEHKVDGKYQGANREIGIADTRSAQENDRHLERLRDLSAIFS